jgi:hypothetical protein
MIGRDNGIGNRIRMKILIRRCQKIWVLSFVVIAFCGCYGQTSEDTMCYEKKLVVLKENNAYKFAMRSFAEYFNTDLLEERSRSLLEMKIDEAIFFGSDSSECVLLILNRSANAEQEGRVFGSARAYTGTLVDRKWTFEPSVRFTFASDYFQRFPENSFEHISFLARESVLEAGGSKRSGCNIDEHYWFVYLQK